MMKPEKTMNRNSEQKKAEVAKTLEMIDRMPEVEVSHLFRVRLMQRIGSMEGRRSSVLSIGGGVFNPRVAFLALLMILNVASAGFLFLHESPRQTGALAGGISETFSEEYGGPALSYYDEQSALDR
jgi:hypothetical protein